MKESEWINEYLDLAWELEEKLWNMRGTMIQIVVGTQGKVQKGLENRLE